MSIQRVNLAIGGGDALSFEFGDADGFDTVALDVARSGLVYYEIPFPTVLGALVRLTDGDFYDVGANTGIFSLLAAAANNNLVAHSFEPVPHIADLFAANVRLNPDLSPRVKQHRIALSDREGSFKMMEHRNPHGHVSTSSSLELEQVGNHSEYSEIDVEVSTLDRWRQHHPGSSPSVMKVDVEGHEHAFFKGAEKTIEEYRPYIIVELLGSADFEYFNNFVRAFKYRDIALFPGSATAQNEVTFHSDAWNHLLCPQEHLWTFACICGEIGLPLGRFR